MFDLAIRGARVLSGSGEVEADVFVAGEEIAAIRHRPFPDTSSDDECDHELEPVARQVFDASGMMLMPGVIDPHVHFGLKSRGTSTADDFSTASACAATGGVTTVIDYADHLPHASLLQSSQARSREIQGSSAIDWSLHQNVTRLDQQITHQLRALRDFGISSVKVFTTYKEAGYMLPESDFAELAGASADAGVLVTVHAEDDDVLTQARSAAQAAGDTAPDGHGRSRPPTAEALAVQRLISAARGHPIYFVHVSTAEAASDIAEARRRGLPVFAETCPHYLLLDDVAYAGPSPRLFIMSPPLRPPHHRQQLWRALREGAIDCISTDHCAYTHEQKSRGDSCFQVLPGIPGVHTSLALVYSYGVVGGAISASRMVGLMCENPARIFGLRRKGKIEVGYDADIVLLEPCGPMALKGMDLASPAGYTPFEGMDVKCRVRRTYLRGKLVAENGRFVGDSTMGKFVASPVQ